MAPVIVCVVLMPDAERGRGVDRERRAGLGREAADRLQLRDLRAHRVDDPPAAGRACRGRWRCARSGSTQNGIGSWPSRTEIAAGEQRARDDAHRLLRVVGAVHQAEGRRREELHPAERASTRRGVDARKTQWLTVIRRSPTTRPISGASTMKMSVFVQRRDDDADEAGLGDRRARIAAEQRVRRARRQPAVPRDQVPDDGADQPREDDGEGHDVEVDHAGADGLRDAGAEDECGDEVEERRPDHGLSRRQHARRDDRRDRVRGVVKAVDVVEDERDGDQRQNREQQVW